VQEGVQSGHVKAEIAQAIGKLAQSGAGMQEIVKALMDAAKQGQVSQKFLASLAELLGGQKSAGSAATANTAGLARQGNGLNTAAVPAAEMLGGQKGAGSAGAGQESPSQPSGLTAPFRQGGLSGAVPGAKRASKRTAAAETNIKRKAEKEMGIDVKAAGTAAQAGGGVPAAGGAQDGKAMLAALISLLQEGVQSGDVDADVPAAVEKLIGTGADTMAVLAALKQAAEAGKVSPLMLAKAEKLLNASSANEATDRTQLMRGNKNQLTR
jgi:hypothetical protein